MSQQVQELIDKIKSEGVQTADKKAKEIEEKAQAKAKRIVEEAQAKAKHITDEADAQAKKTEESTRAALRQAARDMLLALKKEVRNTLQKVISQEVKDALSKEELAHIIEEVVKGIVKANLADHKVEIALSEDDLKKLKDGFIAKLQKEIKRPVTFKTSGGISTGFTISFDQGKSCFDFSDTSLADYLATYLNERVAGLLQKD